MHVNLALLRGGPLSTDFRLVEWQSSVPRGNFAFGPKHEAHDDRSQFEISTCSSSVKKKPSLNLEISKNASLTSCRHWSLDHVPSQRIIHRSIKSVAFALVSVFWHFRSEVVAKAFNVFVVKKIGRKIAKTASTQKPMPR